jgi:hypothetical protein
VIIYDEKEVKFVKPSWDLKGADSLREFIRPLLGICKWKISRLHKQKDNLPLLYKTVKKRMLAKKDFAKKDLRVYYTLYDNNEPYIPANIRDKFKFCKRAYRAKYKSCITKSYANSLTNQLKKTNYVNFDDELFKKFYSFAGIPIRKN